MTGGTAGTIGELARRAGTPVRTLRRQTGVPQTNSGSPGGRAGEYHCRPRVPARPAAVSVDGDDAGVDQDAPPQHWTLF